MKIAPQELTQWLQGDAQWRLIGFLGEEIVIHLMEQAGYTVIKQKQFLIRLHDDELVDLGSKVDLQAINEQGKVVLLEVKSTKRDYEPRLSKAQQNLQRWCAKLAIPYEIITVKFKEDCVELPDSLNKYLKGDEE